LAQNQAARYSTFIAAATDRRCSRWYQCALPGFALLLTGIGACAPRVPTEICPLSSEQRMLVAELFFGRAIRGRAPLSDAEWAEFAAQTITPNFPDGFTTFDGEGQWRNSYTGYIAHEQTIILLVAARPTADLAQRLATVIGAYKARFHQQSVGLITRDACAAF
jgi:Protein of unknown function (DUF3574)